jgi:hypothetical protein
MAKASLSLVLDDFAVLFANELNHAIWPPLLKQLIAQAKFNPDSASYPHQLMALFTEQQQEITDLPMARLRGGSEQSLCADPCYLHPDRDKLLLFYRDLDLSLQEAQELASFLQPLFADMQAKIEVKTSGQWLLEMQTPAEVSFTAKEGLHGLPITDYLPQGPEAEAWIRLANEVQMMLFDCAVNQAREAAGKVPINGIWFWGMSQLPSNWQAWPHVSGETDIVKQLSLLSHSSYQPQTQRFSEVKANHGLHIAKFNVDQDWQQQLLTLIENWLQPAMKALTMWQLKELKLIVPEWGVYRLTPFSRWQFWQ